MKKNQAKNLQKRLRNLRRNKENKVDKKQKKNKKEKEKEKEKVEHVSVEEEVVVAETPSSAIDDILGLGLSDEPTPPSSAVSDPLADIFGPSTSSNNTSSGVASADPAWDNSDIFGGSFGAAASPISDVSSFVKPKQAEVLSASAKGQSGVSGLKIEGRFYRDAAQIKLELQITNTTPNMASDFEMMFNK